MALDTEFLKSIGLDDEDVISKIADKSKEDEGGLLAKRDELLGKVTTYRDQLAQYEGIDVGEYAKMQQRIKELAEQDMSVEDRLAAAKAEATKEWEAKYGEAETKLQQMESAERERLRNESIFRAVGDKGDADLILDTVVAKGLVEVIDNDGKRVLKVHSISGDKELESVDKLIEEMKASEKYARLFNASGLSGGGSRNSSTIHGAADTKLFGAARMRAAREAS